MAAAPQSSPMFRARLLWAMLIVSQLACAVMVSIPGLVERSPVPPIPLHALMFAGVAASVLVASFAVPAFLRKTTLARAKSALASTGPSVLDRDDVSRLFADPEGARGEAFALGFTPFVIAIAFSHAIADLGLVLAFQNHPAWAYLPFFGVGLAATAIRFPTEAAFLVPLARARGATV